MKAGIAIDAWKLPIFDRLLTAAGFTFTNVGQLTDGTLLLRVDTEESQRLAQVVLAANIECAKTWRSA